MVYSRKNKYPLRQSSRSCRNDFDSLPTEIKTGLRIVVGVMGAVLLFGGLRQGEYAVTLNKAIHICLECIGIG